MDGIMLQSIYRNTLLLFQLLQPNMVLQVKIEEKDGLHSRIDFLNIG